MDIASLLGILLAFGLIASAIGAGSAPIAAFIDAPSLLIVFGGCAGAVLVCFPLRAVLSVPRVGWKVFCNRESDYAALVERLVELAEVARRDGLLALEQRISRLENRFIRIGLEMAIDGARPDVVENVLRTEMQAAATRHREGKNLFDQMGKFAPAYGMIGTLVGLIMMLSNMIDPTSIGQGMAVALITTLYGAVASNAVFLPIAEKLAFLNKQESLGYEIIVRGVLDIQSGENPRIIRRKLTTFLPPRSRIRWKAA
ncbi:MAG: motility protein A [Planctomycetes bacterium]|nr:motility protein A [Planctomycetota bacterium]